MANGTSVSPSAEVASAWIVVVPMKQAGPVHVSSEGFVVGLVTIPLPIGTDHEIDTGAFTPGVGS